ncbi:Os09g0559050, partial [Oryza sativa Japonica Group]
LGQVGLERFDEVPKVLPRHPGEPGELLPVRPVLVEVDGGLVVGAGGEELPPLPLGAAVQPLQRRVGVLLQVLEQLPLGEVAVRVEVVAVGVRPAEHPPPLADLLVRLRHEAHLRRRHARRRGHRLQLRPLQALHVAERHAQRLEVGVPPLVVVEVPVQGRLGLPPPLVVGVGAGQRHHRAVGLVPGARRVAVPWLEADPAELVEARRPACHVHAPEVLLDRQPALGAVLCVGEQPRRRLRLRAVLLHPLRHRLARHRPVRLLAAPPAQPVPARAEHLAALLAVAAAHELHGAAAPGPRAPPHPGALLHVRPEREPAEPLPVLAVGHRVDQLAHDGRRARRIRAPERQAPRAVAHRRADVPAPAGDAVEVGAPRRPHPAGVEHVEADGAGEPPPVDPRGHLAAAAVRRQEAGGVAYAALVQEPLLLEQDGPPPVQPEEDGGGARREREHLAHLGNVLLLPRAYVVLG